MCKHIRYRYDLCANRSNYRATKPFCIGPCPQAYNRDGELDFDLLHSCPDTKIEMVGSRSGCCFRRDEGKGIPCWSCQEMGELEPDDPGFEEWIQQGRPGKLGGTLPKLDEMVWHIPSMKMTLPCLNDFTWDQPINRKRKRSDKDEDDTMSEPLSPKSKPAKRGHFGGDDGSDVEEMPELVTRPPSPAPASAPTAPYGPSKHDNVLTSMLRHCTVGRTSSSEAQPTFSAAEVTPAATPTNPFDESWSWSAKPLPTAATADSSSFLSTTPSEQSFVTANSRVPSPAESFVTARTEPCSSRSGSEEARAWREEFWEIL